MIYAICLLVVACVARVSALPGPVRMLDQLPFNFTLAALNTTLPNANSTGAPLVLGQAGSIAGASFEVLSTWASFPFNDWPTMGLVNGTLRPYRTGGIWMTNATVQSGQELSFITSGISVSTAPSIFSAAYQRKNAILAVFGRADLWSLCPSSQTFLPQTNLVFNVSADLPDMTPGFDPAECYDVVVNIVPVPA